MNVNGLHLFPIRHVEIHHSSPLDGMSHEARHQGYSGGATQDETHVPIAATADVLRCYEEAVQEPLVECVNLDGLYTNSQDKHSDRRDAEILREDFCSTGACIRMGD